MRLRPPESLRSANWPWAYRGVSWAQETATYTKPCCGLTASSGAPSRHPGFASTACRSADLIDTGAP